MVGESPYIYTHKLPDLQYPITCKINKKQATKRPKTIREDDMVQTACPAWRHIQSLVPCVTLELQGSAVKGGGRTAEAEETEEEEEEEEKAEEAEDAYKPGKCHRAIRRRGQVL